MATALRRLATYGLLAAAAAVAACTIERGDVRTPSGEPPEADTTRVRQTMEAIATAFEMGDLVSLDTIYHDSVTVFEGGRVERGWLEYRDHHLIPELETLGERRLQLDDIRIRLARTTAWATYRYELSAVRGDEEIEARGVGTMILQKLQGRWRLVHSHTSAAQPEAAARDRPTTGGSRTTNDER